jgi:hypothetical protein
MIYIRSLVDCQDGRDYRRTNDMAPLVRATVLGRERVHMPRRLLACHMRLASVPGGRGNPDSNSIQKFAGSVIAAAR